MIRNFCFKLRFPLVLAIFSPDDLAPLVDEEALDPGGVDAVVVAAERLLLAEGRQQQRRALLVQLQRRLVPEER